VSKITSLLPAVVEVPIVQFLEKRQHWVWRKPWAWSPRTWPAIQALLLIQCVTLIKSLSLSEPRFAPR
jgi:hypothetical protein